MPVAGAAGAGGADAGIGGIAWAGVGCGIIPGAGGAGMALTGAGVPMSIALRAERLSGRGIQLWTFSFG